MAKAIRASLSLAWAEDACRQRAVSRGRPGHLPRDPRWVAPVTLAIFGLWNVLLLAQFSLGMISHTQSVPFAQMVSNQPKVVARLIERAGQIFRQVPQATSP